MAAIELDEKYPTLVKGFLKAMEEVGQYGLLKYGEMSFEFQLASGNKLERFPRTETSIILDHSYEHSAGYECGTPHDHFNTLRHQLAAAAFNLMLEYAYADLDNEPAPTGVLDAATSQLTQGQSPDSPRD